MKRFWIVSAHKKEIPGIEEILLSNADVLYFQCGIGLFESFYNFSALANTTEKIPDGVLLVGTAGSPDSGDLFRLCLASEFYNPHFRFEDLPEFLPEKWSTEKFSVRAAEGRDFVEKGSVLSRPVYSTFGVSNSTDQLGEFMQGAWENMEALSLSYICHKKQIPFMAMLCCTNAIGPEGREDWKKNYLRAGEILAENLKEMFGGESFPSR